MITEHFSCFEDVDYDKVEELSLEYISTAYTKYSKKDITQSEETVIIFRFMPKDRRRKIVEKFTSFFDFRDFIAEYRFEDSTGTLKQIHENLQPLKSEWR